MEIRANYIIVGVFTLAMLFAGFVFTLWIAKDSKNTAMSEYDIFFYESVTGLSLNSEVLFNGIRVGNVTQIKISHTDPGEVRVRIAIDADTPVRQNSEAKLALRGLTGGSIVTISGGTAGSRLNVPPPGKVGVIQYSPSPLASVLSQVPDVISTVNEAMHRINTALSDENLASVSQTLHSLSSFTGALAQHAGAVGDILEDTRESSRQFKQLMTQAEKIVSTDVKRSGEALSRLATRLDSTLTAMEPGLKQFSREGLGELRMLIVEARNLMHVLTRVGQKLENDPRRFFFGESVQEYRSK